jgi:hypothetical protein
VPEQRRYFDLIFVLGTVCRGLVWLYLSAESGRLEEPAGAVKRWPLVKIVFANGSLPVVFEGSNGD